MVTTCSSVGCSPSQSSQATVQLQEGDLLVAATDGLFSNMYDEDIASHLSKVKVRMNNFSRGMVTVQCVNNFSLVV